MTRYQSKFLIDLLDGKN